MLKGMEDADQVRLRAVAYVALDPSAEWRGERGSRDRPPPRDEQPQIPTSTVPRAHSRAGGAERPSEIEAVAASLHGVTHRYGKTVALDNVTLEIPAGRMTGLIGPDGVGKSTLLGLIAGVRKIQTGEVRALGGDLKDEGFRQGAFAHRLHAPGPRPQPLPHAQRLRESSTSSAGCSARAKRSRRRASRI